MFIDENLLTPTDKLVLELKSLYTSRGYQPYRMSRFEEYDFYAGNKDFLVSDNVLTFTDNNGKLMALKPDITLSIIKNCQDISDEKRKVFYNENVYRSDKRSGSFREILQTGLESFGNIDDADIREVILLAVQSLKKVSEDSILMISDLTLIEQLIRMPDFSPAAKKRLLTAIRERNLDDIDQICRISRMSPENVTLIRELLACHGLIRNIRTELEELLNKLHDNEETRFFASVINDLCSSDEADHIGIDFSITDDLNYYNGIIFKGYVNALPEAVLSGGQYDRLMEKLYRKLRAIGFAVYTGIIEQSGEPADTVKDDYINIALPKGRLGEKVYKMFAESGYECPDILEENRKLVFENSERKVRYFWVKPADVGIYVENGVADIGVVGKDILLEQESQVYELLDLKTGICRMAVAAPKGFRPDPARTLKVATKFPNIAEQYYSSIGMDIDVIHLNGSIEIAPILGLSDVIVDIVETGRTLKENNLEVIKDILDISARLIANHSSYAFKSELINDIRNNLEKAVK